MKFILTLCLSFLLVGSPLLAIPQAYESLWTRVLERHVVSGRKGKIQTHLVDYKGIQKSQSFRTLVRMIGNVDTGTFITADEAKAFWLNAFNIATFKLIIEYEPQQSVMILNLPNQSFWGINILEINEGYYSLDQIKRELLRYGDPKVMFGMTPGMISSPDLRREAYTSGLLKNQLNDQIERYTKNKTKGIRPDTGTQTLYISQIFEDYQYATKEFHGTHKLIQPYVKQNVSFYSLAKMPFSTDLNQK